MGRVYRATLRAGAVLAALVLGLAAVAVTCDVVGRNLGIGSFTWVPEASEFALPLSTFLVAPWLLLRGEHIRLDILLQSLPRRAARLLNASANAAGAAICAVLVAFSAQAAIEAARQSAMVMKTFTFPEWWQYAPMSACFALLAAEFLRRLLVRNVPGSPDSVRPG